MSKDDMKICYELARSHNVTLLVRYYDKFRESYTEVGTKNSNLVKRIYATCQIAHVWRCHTVANGYFYKCPQSYFLPKLLSHKKGIAVTQDGIRISNSRGFGEELLAYLNSTTPMAACRYCLGSVGKLFPHEQVRRTNWNEPQERSTEELLDPAHLMVLEEIDNGADNRCVSTERKLN